MYKEVEQIIISIISIQSDTHVFVSKKIQLGIGVQADTLMYLYLK